MWLLPSSRYFTALPAEDRIIDRNLVVQRRLRKSKLVPVKLHRQLKMPVEPIPNTRLDAEVRRQVLRRIRHRHRRSRAAIHRKLKRVIARSYSPRDIRGRATILRMATARSDHHLAEVRHRRNHQRIRLFRRARRVCRSRRTRARRSATYSERSSLRHPRQPPPAPQLHASATRERYPPDHPHGLSEDSINFNMIWTPVIRRPSTASSYRTSVPTATSRPS